MTLDSQKTGTARPVIYHKYNHLPDENDKVAYAGTMGCLAVIFLVLVCAFLNNSRSDLLNTIEAQEKKIQQLEKRTC